MPVANWSGWNTDEYTHTLSSEAEFLDVIGTKLVFLLAIHNHLY
jgi:hypothetical protein